MVLVTEDMQILIAYITKVSINLCVYIILFCVFSAIHPYVIPFVSCVSVGLFTIYLMSNGWFPVCVVFLVDTTKAIITVIIVFSIIGLVLYFYPFPLSHDNDRLLPSLALY